MKIERPTPEYLPQLKQLWQLAFGEEEAFVELFFHRAYDPCRCRCAVENGRVLAALYWFDAGCGEDRIAYIYGVATHPDARGNGLCRTLMADTHGQLTREGYSSVLLVPQKESLRAMYAGFGYREATALGEAFCAAGPEPQPMHAIDREEFARLRRQWLPVDGVVQEGVSLEFLEGYAKFYKGADFLLCAVPDGESLLGIELLGNRETAPGILRSLGYSQGTFRFPGEKRPFSMFLPLKPGAAVPGYFGLAFD